MHYFSRLENTIKSNWDGIALANFRGETFTFGELAKQIARFHVFFETVGLKKGDKVQLVGFGTFAVTKKPAREGINPATKQKIKIAAKKVAKFKAGAELAKAVDK